MGKGAPKKGKTTRAKPTPKSRKSNQSPSINQPTPEMTQNKTGMEMAGGDRVHGDENAGKLSPLPTVSQAIQYQQDSPCTGASGEITPPVQKDVSAMKEIQLLKSDLAEAMAAITLFTNKVTEMSGNNGNQREIESDLELNQTSNKKNGTNNSLSQVGDTSSVSETESESESEVVQSNPASSTTIALDDQSQHYHWVDRSSRRSSHISRLPSFTGKEKWKVWFNRFSEVADLKQWSEAERLTELLQKIQDGAGDFVFGQLTKETRKNYKKLVAELRNRYRVVETRLSYHMKFSRRNQLPKEKVEDYAAELKRLYDCAHGLRDQETRREDLIRRFLDGVLDEEASFQVEYIKTPKSIDEAVYELVNFREKKGYLKEKQTVAGFLKTQ